MGKDYEYVSTFSLLGSTSGVVQIYLVSKKISSKHLGTLATAEYPDLDYLTSTSFLLCLDEVCLEKRASKVLPAHYTVRVFTNKPREILVEYFSPNTEISQSTDSVFRLSIFRDCATGFDKDAACHFFSIKIPSSQISWPHTSVCLLPESPEVPYKFDRMFQFTIKGSSQRRQSFQPDIVLDTIVRVNQYIFSTLCKTWFSFGDGKVAVYKNLCTDNTDSTSLSLRDLESVWNTFIGQAFAVIQKDNPKGNRPLPVMLVLCICFCFILLNTHSFAYVLRYQIALQIKNTVYSWLISAVLQLWLIGLTRVE